MPHILIAGIGNIFLGDDAFGCEVLRKLSQQTWPEDVRLVDFGIRGFDLAYALLEDYEVTILVDAAPRGEAPGTVYTIEPDLDALETYNSEGMMLETHGMNPMKVLAMVRSMGGQLKKLLLVGCEPQTFGPEEGQMGLSAPVEAAVNEAVKVVEVLIARFRTTQTDALCKTAYEQ
jgi:hydrogenase maturation protease